MSEASNGAHEPADDAHPPGRTTPLADLPGLGGFVALGMTIAVCVGVGVVLGIWADSAWGLAPWGLLIGLVSGTALAVVSVVKLVRQWL